jgi:hypothetical protein
MHFLVVNGGILHVRNAGFFSGKKRTVNGDDMVHKVMEIYTRRSCLLKTAKELITLKKYSGR